MAGETSTGKNKSNNKNNGRQQSPSLVGAAPAGRQSRRPRKSQAKRQSQRQQGQIQPPQPPQAPQQQQQLAGQPRGLAKLQKPFRKQQRAGQKAQQIQLQQMQAQAMEMQAIQAPAHPHSSSSSSTKSLKIHQASKSPANINAKPPRDVINSPSFYKQLAMAARSPSQLSFRNITDFYTLQPESNFVHLDDVYHHRGFKKKAKIDEGAFGVVSLGVRLDDKSLLAIKEVDLRHKKAKRIEEMKRELFCLQRIDNEHVVKLIEHLVVGQMLVIVMEYCGGGNFTSFLKSRTLSEDDVLFYFRQMAYSVQVLHRAGIAHRDIKLNNFLLDFKREIVKIADFGLSIMGYKPIAGIQMAKTYCGTEPYMAPEILRRNSAGVRAYNPISADIWALGVCLFAMLTRTFPFSLNSGQKDLLRAQKMRKWKYPKNLRESLSDQVKDLTWHLLDPEPERRITMVGVMSHPWINGNKMITMKTLRLDLVQKSVSSTMTAVSSKQNQPKDANNNQVAASKSVVSRT